MKVNDFDFSLDEKYIAKFPVNPRDSAKLLYVPDFKNYHVSDLPDLINEGDLIVFNDTKVLPVRIYGKRDSVKIEATLHKMIKPNLWWAFAKPGKRLKPGQIVNFENDVEAAVIDKNPDNGVLFEFKVNEADMFSFLEKFGEMPLPPYIKRNVTEQDKEQYQTIYAKKQGAVAAPTAGLHFTENLLEKLKEKGIEFAYVTLHVGAGTFLPVKVEDTKNHKMHSEFGIVSKETAEKINMIKKAGKNVISVGTTTLRILESAADDKGIIHPFKDETDIFITPGYKFKSSDYLMTNFHLPKSTLFMLVSAFSGLDVMKKAYEFAKENDYRFYSFGDSSLLKCENKI